MKGGQGSDVLSGTKVDTQTEELKRSRDEFEAASPGGGWKHGSRASASSRQSRHCMGPTEAAVAPWGMQPWK